MCRIAGETGITLDVPAKRQYATCLVVALRPSSLENSTALPIRAHRGDALCLLQSDLGQSQTLGGMKIAQDGLDYSVVQQWLSWCLSRQGSNCKPLFTPALKSIHLLDIESREIVLHPGHECDYVALSYVWADVEQSTYRRGDRLKHLPQAIEDSITVTSKLGKRYLWVDSLCIDQTDQVHKDSQIRKMRDIYHRAWVTIIAISGNSADSGLPRVSSKNVDQQMTCCIEGKRLIGLMPSLSQQVWLSTWGQRG